MTNRILVVLNNLSLILMITVNILANTLPINGMNTGELSALYPNEFVPAGYTFSIWLLIYISLIGFSVYQTSSLWKEDPKQTVARIGILFILTNLLNASWIFAWHYKLVALSVVIMLCLLLTLISIHRKLPIPDGTRSIHQKFWVQTSFSIYLGWIMTATVANITAWLVSLGWQGSPLSSSAWAMIMIAVAGLLSLWMLFIRKNKVIPLITIWSVGGIIAKQRAVNGFNNISITGAVICAGLLLAVLMSTQTRPSA